MSGNGPPRSKEGVPQWDGDSATFQDFEEQSLQWEQSVAYHKRYLCGPKLIAELSGPARKHVTGKRPDWVSYDGGVTHLLRHLRECLGRPAIPEMTEHLNRYFRQSRRRRYETMNAYVTRKTETYHRARQALARIQQLHERHPTRPQQQQQWQEWNWWNTNNWNWWERHGPQTWESHGTSSRDESEARDPGVPEEERWYDAEAEARPGPSSQEGRSSGGWSSAYNPYEDEEWKVATDELLPEFLQGWYLMMDAGLELSERNMIQTAVREDFSVQRISQELRRQWPDEELKRRDQAAKFSGFWHDDILSVEEEPEWEGEEFTAEGLTEEGQALYGEAAYEIQEAQAVIQQAKRTLRDARARQHQVRLSRQYYKTSYTKNHPGDKSYRPRSDQGGGKDSCLRCGKSHRTSDCPDRQPTTGKPVVGHGNLAGEEAPFVCFTEESALSTEGGTAMTGKTTREAVRAGFGVIDGGATKTLGSVEAIQAVMDLNKEKHGSNRVKTIDLDNKPTFGFGNSSQDTCISTADLQLTADNRPGELQVHALDKGQGPILVSIHTLRKLKAVIDFEADLMVLRGLNSQKLIPLQRSAAGHQLISLTDDLFKDAITCKSQVPGLKDYI